MARRIRFYVNLLPFVFIDEKGNRSMGGVLIVRFWRFNNRNNKHAMRQRDLLRFGVKLIAFRSG